MNRQLTYQRTFADGNRFSTSQGESRAGNAAQEPWLRGYPPTKAGCGGETVTVIKGSVGIGLPEKEQLARATQKASGVRGTVKGGQIEIQGDKREEVARILLEAGFGPVFAGG